ncbi:protein FAM151B [Augochlora pura]
MMLEGDVKMGVKKDSTNKTKIPIMSHDSEESDLTLDEFVEVAIKNGTKGVKLDFKATDAYKSSTGALKKLVDAKFPVFINADIIKGPGGKEPAVDKAEFLKIANEHSNLTLSLGWTTEWNNEKPASYSNEDIDAMSKTVAEHDLKQQITYAVRAALAENSHEQMVKLVNNTGTLTIWTAEKDNVNTTKLSELIQKIGIDKIYLDLPDTIKTKLNLNGAPSMSSAIMTVISSLLVSVFVTQTALRG